jgi:hypothetical protein
MGNCGATRKFRLLTRSFSIGYVFVFPDVNTGGCATDLVVSFCKRSDTTVFMEPQSPNGRIQDALGHLSRWVSLMASSNEKPPKTVLPSPPTGSANETSRAKSIATRLTDAELGEVEAAAAIAGKKVAEWLRDAALTHARAGQEEQTDPVLLAEIMGMRNLMLNLFAKASQGPLSVEDVPKMSAYSDSIKEQKAEEFLTQRRRRNSLKGTDKA